MGKQKSNQIIPNYNVQDNMCMSHLITSENKLLWMNEEQNVDKEHDAFV